MKDWLTLIIVILIIGIVLDGLRRMRMARRENLRLSKNAIKADMEGDLPLNNSEFPSGGARVAAVRAEEDAKGLNANVRKSFVAGRVTVGAQRIPSQVSLNLDEAVPMLMDSLDHSAQDKPARKPQPHPRKPKAKKQTASALRSQDNEPAIGSLADIFDDQAEPLLSAPRAVEARQPAWAEEQEPQAYDYNSHDDSYAADSREQPGARQTQQDDYNRDHDSAGQARYRDTDNDYEDEHDDGYSEDRHTDERVTYASDEADQDGYDYDDPAYDATYDDNPDEQPSPQSTTRSDAHSASPSRENKTRFREPDEVLIINVMAKNGQRFHGSDLLAVLMEQGLKFGDMDIFHRHLDNDGDAPILFSLANMVVPGTFNLAAMDEFETPGVSMFLSLPVAGESLAAYNDLAKTAKYIAERLGGELKDENRSVMTAQTIEHGRQRVIEYERKRKLAHA